MQSPEQKRDFIEETALNAAEERSIVWGAGKLGLSKSAFIRCAIHFFVDYLVRQERLSGTGINTEL